MFRDELYVLEFSVANDLFLHLLRALPTFSCDLIFRPAYQGFPGRFGQVLGTFDEIRRGIKAEDRSYVLVIPPVQMHRLAEIRVALEPDLFEAGSTAKFNCLVESLGSVLV